MTSAPARRPRRLSLGPRLALAFAAPATVAVIACGAAAYLGTRALLEEELGRRLCSLATVGASLVDPELAATLGPSDEDTRTAQNVRRRLESVRVGASASRVVLVDQQRKVLMDTSRDLPIGAEAPRLRLDQVELERAAGGAPTASVLFDGPDGRLHKSCYARVPGDMAMFVAVEGAADLFSNLATLAGLYALLSLLAFALLTAVAFAVGRQIARPLFRLSQEVRAVGEGDLKSPITVSDDDEVGQVAAALDEMRQRINARDAERQMMLAGIAHEVRNPLGGMELYAGLLAEAAAELPDDKPALKEEIVNAAGRIRQELRYLAGVVNDFLTFARDTPPQRKEVHAARLLGEVGSLCAGDAGNKGVNLVVHPADPALVIHVDEGLVKGALLNLVQNAVQATPAGGTVEVRAEVQTALVHLSVKDNGPGMDEAALEKALTPFFTTKEKGTGLGLPLVVKIARSHGGRLDMKTAPGQGCHAQLVIPARLTASGSHAVIG
ncbi:MAG: HAMP domain-containing histidine kinase [Deltaproteobacteria bacterium]|nr:HAMP domain-containing histidine kinase [Deltaproteobacteria bacterium]